MDVSQSFNISSFFLQQKDVQTLCLALLKTIKSKTNACDVSVLQPNRRALELIPVFADQQPVKGWHIHDFSHPFAHAWQSGMPQLLDYSNLLCWRQNQDFVDCIRTLKNGMSLFIVPISAPQGYILGLVVFTASSKEMDDLISQPFFTPLLQFFSLCWQNILDKITVQHERKYLEESVSHYQEKEKVRQQEMSLSSVLRGSSQAMGTVRKNIITAAQSTLSVLIQGETGTGKELVASAIHYLSGRVKNPFVAVNCAAIPEHLLESELFGYKKGAFSGAVVNKKGLIAQANGGVLFLDEIGDMPLSLQAKLLRVLETYSCRPLGETKDVHSDFRLIAATHVDLNHKSSIGEFRKDLFYRICQFPLNLPPLAKRDNDIEELAHYFVELYNKSNGCNISGIEHGAIRYLYRQNFSGNVRELRNYIEYACAKNSNSKPITSMCWMSSDQYSQQDNLLEGDDLTASTSNQEAQQLLSLDLRQTLARYEKKIIHDYLSYHKGNRTKVAKSLGIPKRTLAYKCTKLEIC